MFSRAVPPRRIAAVVLPLLASEVARASGSAPADRPLAVLIDAAPRDEAEAEAAARTIDAVDEAAHALGVRPGQRVSEASALTAGLVVARVAARAIEAALAGVADVATGLGPTVSIGAPDTVWVDVTGVAHLWGTEEALLRALEERVRGLGHRARGAIGDGPRIARALARFAAHAGAPRIHAPGRGGEALARLPVRSLFRLEREGGSADDVVARLARLGVRRVADLVRLPAGAAAARLGPTAQEVLALATGNDPEPLVPHAPPPRIEEEVSLDDGVESAPALVFVARGLVSRGAARLAARGEAACRIDVELLLDRSIAALRIAPVGPANDAPPTAAPRAPLASSSDLALAIDLPAPLAHEPDLLRAVKAKIEALTLPAPVVAVRLALSRITAAPEVQIGMGPPGGGGRAVAPAALAALLSELSAEIGAERLGVLAVRDDHRPEARTALEPPQLDDAPPPRVRRAAARRAPNGPPGGRASDFDLDLLPSPTRVLGRAPVVSISGRVGRGTRLRLGARAFVVEDVVFDRRVDGARWWTDAPAARDYMRVWLRSDAPPPGRPAGACVEAWIYVDRATGAAVLQGLWE
jgi:protein ImuB